MSNNSKKKNKVSPAMAEEQQDVTVVKEQKKAAVLAKPAEKNIVEGGFVMTSDEKEEERNVLRQDLERLGSVGAIFQYYRELRGLSINEVAGQIQMRMTSVSDIEHDLLNQETAVNFTRPLIERYAKFLNIDAPTMSEMYCVQVKETVRITRMKSNATEQANERYKKRNIVLLILILAVAGYGYYHFSAKEESAKRAAEAGESVSQEASLMSGTLGGDGSPETPMVEMSTEPMVTGTLSNGDEAPEEDQGVVIEDEANKESAPVVVVDANTARAQAQAQALTREAAQPEEEEPAAAKALPLKSGTSSLASNVTISSDSDPFAAHKAEQRAQQERQAQAKAARAEQERAAKAEQRAREQRQAEQERARAEQERRVAEERARAAKAEQQKQQASGPKLSSTLKDISSQVKVVNRESLASLNSAEVSVSKDVFVKITDGRGDECYSGVAHKGENIHVSGIPPFKVAVTDTSAVKISYNGGTVVVPKAKQASFVLPMR